MSATPSTSVLIAGLGATLQLFRISIDLVASVTNHAEKEDKKIDNKSKKGTNKAISTAAITNPTSGSSKGILSYLGINHAHKKDTTNLSNAINTTTKNGYSSIPTTTQDNELSTEEQALSDRSSLEKSIPCIALFIHVCILLFFSFSIFYPLVQQSDSYPVAIYAAALGMSVFMDLQDWNRRRLTWLQRFLNILSCFSLLTGFGLTSYLSELKFDTTHILFGTCLVLYFVFAIVESLICQYPLIPTSKKKAGLSRKAIFIILKPYIWPSATGSGNTATLNRVRAILTWFCVGGSKACNLVAPIYIGKASTALSQYDFAACIKYAIIYNAILFTGSALKECQGLVYLKVAQAAFVQLSEFSFSHIHNMSLDWHLKKKLGEVIRSMDRGISACDTLMKYLFLWLIPALTECLLVCIIFASYFQYFPLALVVFFFAFAYVLATIVLTLWRKKFRKKVTKSDNDWHDRCTDSLINFETVKYFTAEDYEKKRFSESVKDYQTGSVIVQASLSLLNILQQILSKGCIASALAVAAIGIQQRRECCIVNGCADISSACCSALATSSCPGMEIGDFVTVLTYTINLFIPLNFLGTVYNAVVMAIVDLSNLSELLAENPDIKDNPDALTLPSQNIYDPSIAVEFDNVFFHYPTQTEESGLQGLSFKMKKGTITAIVGTTGSGKTTTSRLLFRFYDVISGAVKVNGADVRTLTQKSLRDAIGVVPQTTTLFNDTIRANIMYGKRDATDEELERVARDAQLDSFIETLPDGWNTMVGDRGLKLSGGEKQRVSIARCLLKNPPFVVLDEATSALDTVTESSVQNALDRLGAERTCLVIAHRLGTIRNADNIIVLDKGKVLEQGTHDELLNGGGKYAEMWNMQLHSTSQRNSSNALENMLKDQLDTQLDNFLQSSMS